MLKITKFGMICSMVSDMTLFLGIAEDESKDHLSALNSRHYYYATGLADYLRSLGIYVEFYSAHVGDRNRFVGVAIKDGSKGAPAFAPCARCVFSGSSFGIMDEIFPTFETWCEENGYSSDIINREMKKIYGCK